MESLSHPQDAPLPLTFEQARILLSAAGLALKEGKIELVEWEERVQAVLLRYQVCKGA